MDRDENVSSKIVHTIHVYMVDGLPKPCCDALYVKQGEKIKWVAADPDREFEIGFEFGSPLGFKTDRTPTKEHPANGKVGRHKYNIKDIEEDTILDPTIDIGKP